VIHKKNYIYTYIFLTNSGHSLSENQTPQWMTCLRTWSSRPGPRTQPSLSGRAPDWSVAVSTSCFQRPLSWACRHAEFRPWLSDWMSASRVRSQVWRGRPERLKQRPGQRTPVLSLRTTKDHGPHLCTVFFMASFKEESSWDKKTASHHIISYHPIIWICYGAPYIAQRRHTK